MCYNAEVTYMFHVIVVIWTDGRDEALDIILAKVLLFSINDSRIK